MRPVSEVEKEIQSLERSKAYIFFVDDNLLGTFPMPKNFSPCSPIIGCVG
jgi:hypothetical protein